MIEPTSPAKLPTTSPTTAKAAVHESERAALEAPRQAEDAPETGTGRRRSRAVLEEPGTEITTNGEGIGDGGGDHDEGEREGAAPPIGRRRRRRPGAPSPTATATSASAAESLVSPTARST